MAPVPGTPSSNSGDMDGTSSLQGTTPSMTQTGDFLIAIVALETAPGHGNASSATFTEPMGWTQRNVTFSGMDLAVGIFTKLAVAADADGGASYTWGFNDSYRASIQMENFGKIGGTPVGFGPTCTPTTLSSSITAPGMTTVPNNTLNVAIWVSASDQVPTPPAAYTAGFEAGVWPTGGAVGPLPSFSWVVVPMSGTMTGDQVATITVPTDNIGCQINLSPDP
jgi:hypothetical protein